jgi:hypothetical protein
MAAAAAAALVYGQLDEATLAGAIARLPRAL